jgi:ribose transport system ATP-binding protein
LDNVQIEVKSGEVHALIGENGAGKSTLMKVLTGIYKQNSGEIYFKDQLFEAKNPRDAQAKGISIIHQELNLLPDLSVADNIFVTREPTRFENLMINDELMIKKSKEILKKLGMDIDPTTKVSELSVAQNQMIEIAKALIVKSEILVLDEPTSALAAHEVEVLFKIIKQLRAEGVGIIYISHRLEEFDEIVDRVTILRDGTYICTKDWKDSSIAELVKYMVGRSLTEQHPKRDFPVGEVVFEAKNIIRGKILKDVSINVRKGEVLGIAGLMGAGRTELARAIFGADKKESGNIYVEGNLVKINSTMDAIKNGIIYLSEDRKKDGLFLDLDIATNITIANLPGFAKYGVINDKQSSKVVADKIKELSVKTPSEKQIAQYLSGGNQQKVLICRWLCLESKVIIFDEPTRGIDVGSKFEIYTLINELAKAGKSIIMISSEMPEILGMSDRIVVMHEGRVTGEISKDEANQELVLNMASGLEKSEVEL